MYMCSFGAMHAPPAVSIIAYRYFVTPPFAISCTPPWPGGGSFVLDSGLGRVQDFASSCAHSVPRRPRSCRSELKVCFEGHRGAAPVWTLCKPTNKPTKPYFKTGTYKYDMMTY